MNFCETVESKYENYVQWVIKMVTNCTISVLATFCH